MRFALVVVLALAVGVSAAAAGAPPGATALCRDGTYSDSKHHSGTCSHHGGVKRWLDGSGSHDGGFTTGRTVLLGHRTQTSDCIRSARPDRHCSPAAYYSHLTKRVLCSPSFRTSAIRNVPEAEKFRVEREYGMQPGSYGYAIE